MDVILTTKQAAKKLGISARRVRDFINEGRLPATKPGIDWLIREADLALVEGRRTGRPRRKQQPTEEHEEDLVDPK